MQYRYGGILVLFCLFAVACSQKTSEVAPPDASPSKTEAGEASFEAAAVGDQDEKNDQGEYVQEDDSQQEKSQETEDQEAQRVGDIPEGHYAKENDNWLGLWLEDGTFSWYLNGFMSAPFEGTYETEGGKLLLTRKDNMTPASDRAIPFLYDETQQTLTLAEPADEFSEWGAYSGFEDDITYTYVTEKELVPGLYTDEEGLCSLLINSDGTFTWKIGAREEDAITGTYEIVYDDLFLNTDKAIPFMIELKQEYDEGDRFRFKIRENELVFCFEHAALLPDGSDSEMSITDQTILRLNE